MMRPGLLLMLCLLTLAGCAAEEPESDAVSADSVTQRERQEAVGESQLPGAAGVRGALEASDAADERNAGLDSVSDTP